MSDFNTSGYDIISAEITSHSDKNKSFDIHPLIISIDLSQSILKSMWEGSISVLDYTSFLEKFPLRGEEELRLNLKTYDTGYEIDLNCQIYKINNVKATENNNGVTYVLHFVSKASYIASTKKVTKSYRDIPCSSIVKKIFKEKYANCKDPNNIIKEVLPFSTKKFKLLGDKNKGRNLYIQPTNGAMRTVIPNYSTQTAINFLKKKSHSEITPSSSYRFFETFDGYFFVTDEYLIRYAIDNNEIEKLNYNAFIELDPERVIDQVRNIETLANPTRVDVGTAIHNGAYMNNVIEIDLLRRKVNNNFFNYDNDARNIDTSGNQAKISSDAHTIQFIKDTFNRENAKRVIVYKDYSQEGDIPGSLRSDQYYNEIISRRLSQNYHMNSISVNIILKGRLDISAGSMVKISANNFSADKKKEENGQLSGNYLVETINHSFKNGLLSTTARLIKYNWSKD
jgi:hypothetical protein